MRPTAGAEDQVGYGIDHWRPVRGSHLEHGDVGLLPDFERQHATLTLPALRSTRSCGLVHPACATMLVGVSRPAALSRFTSVRECWRREATASSRERPAAAMTRTDII